MKVNTGINPDKVYNIIKENQDKIKENTRIVSEKTKAVLEYKAAQAAVKRVTQRNVSQEREER